MIPPLIGKVTNVDTFLPNMDADNTLQYAIENGAGVGMNRGAGKTRAIIKYVITKSHWGNLVYIAVPLYTFVTTLEHRIRVMNNGEFPSTTVVFTFQNMCSAIRSSALKPSLILLDEFLVTTTYTGKLQDPMNSHRMRTEQEDLVAEMENTCKVAGLFTPVDWDPAVYK